MINKILLAIGAVLLVLALTNPSEADFKAFAHYDYECAYNLSTGRTVNGLVFSMYECKCYDRGNYPVKYVGVAKNFVKL